jgi:hypothetical protein
MYPAPNNALNFASAYRQLRPAEKAYVDGYIQTVERDAARIGERISNALYRVIPGEVVEASRGMLDRPLVRAAIAERINELAAASELTVHRVLKEYMSIAFASMGDYMTVGEDGQPMFDLAKCTPEQLAAIKTVEVEEGVRGRKFKFTLHDKLGALAPLGKYMGMLEADNPHWRNDNARPVDQTALPADTSADKAADLYAAMVNG